MAIIGMYSIADYLLDENFKAHFQAEVVTCFSPKAKHATFAKFVFINSPPVFWRIEPDNDRLLNVSMLFNGLPQKNGIP